MKLRLLFWIAGCLASLAAFAQVPDAATRFSYVGSLSDAEATVATGSYDFRARLYDSQSGGNAIGAELLLLGTPVVAGQFALELDFGSAVLSPQAWLELGVRRTGTPLFETLAPRQRIGSVPVALYAPFTDSAQRAPWSGITGIPASLADGSDADTLAGLGCAPGQSSVVNASGVWGCAAAPEDGLSVLHGAGVPAAALGRIGEFYIDTDATRLYGPKTGAGWGAGVSLIGPPGGGPSPPIPDTPVGTIVIDGLPSGGGTSSSTLSLRAINLGVRQSSVSPYQIYLEDLAVVAAAEQLLPLMFTRSAAGFRFPSLRVDLVGAGTAAAPLLRFDNAVISSLNYVPPTEAPEVPLVAVSFRFARLTVNGIAFYDQTTNTVGGTEGICTSYLGTLAQGTPPPDFVGRVVESSVALGVQNETPVTGGTPAVASFSDPSISLGLAGLTPEEVRNAAMCAFANAVRDGVASRITLSRYVAGAIDINAWAERFTWTDSRYTSMSLQASPGSLAIGYSLNPRRILVETPNVRGCWDVLRNMAC